MAKQCASKLKSGTAPAHVHQPGSARGWEERIFKNTYVRAGIRRQIRAWAVRIQFQGVRKTFSLKAKSRRQAALEAREIHERILAEGWDGTAQWLRSRLPGPPALAEGSAAKDGLAYWRQRLIRRKYTEPLRPEVASELSVQIGDETRVEWFPLGTQTAEPGSARALGIYRTLKREGWQTVCARFPRELTVAIFWAVSPVAITYTTIYSLVDDAPANPLSIPARDKRGRILAVIEADSGIQRALAFWLNRQPGVRCVITLDDVTGFERGVANRNPPELVLVNRDLAAIERLKSQAPHLPVFAYATAEHIDHIFNSLSGVKEGYIFRRRVPGELLEPIAGALSQETFSAEQVGQHVRAYFSQLFALGVPVGGNPRIANLTARELEILSLLSKGWADKEIADMLRISAWTVHSHLKKIYEKLRVHTRTEAVVKYLEK
jgi:DNA-binding NarL/FixJ family response regulator